MVAMDFVRAYEPQAGELGKAVSDVLAENPDADAAAIRVEILKQHRTWKITEKQVAKFASVEASKESVEIKAEESAPLKAEEEEKSSVDFVRVYEPKARELERAVASILEEEPEANAEAVRVTVMKQHRTWKVAEKKVAKAIKAAKVAAYKKANAPPPSPKKAEAKGEEVDFVRAYSPRSHELYKEVNDYMRTNPRATVAEIRASVMKQHRTWNVTEKKISKVLKMTEPPSAKKSASLRRLALRSSSMSTDDDSSVSSRGSMRSFFSRSNKASSKQAPAPALEAIADDKPAVVVTPSADDDSAEAPTAEVTFESNDTSAAAEASTEGGSSMGYLKVVAGVAMVAGLAVVGARAARR